MQVIAYVLDAVLGPVCASAHAQSFSSDLARISSELLAARPAHPACLAGMGKLLEACGPILRIVPSQGAGAIDAFFALVQSMHSLRANAPVGNNDLAPYVREQRQLTKSYFNVSSRAPAAFVPHLSSVAERTLELTRSGVLGSADKNVVFEGIFVSAATSSKDMFAMVVTALVQPESDAWVALKDCVASEASLVQAMLSPVHVNPEQGQSSMRVHGGDARQAAFYTLQLLAFCARQAAAAPHHVAEVRSCPLCTALLKSFVLLHGSMAVLRALGCCQTCVAPYLSYNCCARVRQVGFQCHCPGAQCLFGHDDTVAYQLIATVMQCLSAHLEWMLLPAARLLSSLSGLSQPSALGGSSAPLQAILQLSPLEKAAAIGQYAFLDAKSKADELEPDRMDPASLHGVRGWLKQSKELVRAIWLERICVAALERLPTVAVSGKHVMYSAPSACSRTLQIWQHWWIVHKFVVLRRRWF